MSNKNPRIAVTIDPDTLEVLQAIADEYNISVSKVAARYLRDSAKALLWWYSIDPEEQWYWKMESRSCNPIAVHDYRLHQATREQIEEADKRKAR